MKRYLLPILTVFALAISLIGCSSDEQAGRHQEESASEFDAQAVFQKVDNLQVESFLRQQDINDKISTYQDETRFHVSPALVPELENQVKFLRQQYQQLQEIKYELEPEALDNLMTDSLLEQQRMKTAIETKEAQIIDAQKELEKDPDQALSAPVNILIWKGQIKVMTEQLEFLTKQYQQLEVLRDFLEE